MKKKLIIIIIIIIVLIGVLFILRGSEDTWICENNEWVRHGNPKASQPTDPCGENKEEQDIIVYLEENQVISSPLTVKGKARGTWFFEADFPVVLVNWDGLIIGQSIATAKQDWMTEDFVEFEVSIDFEKPDYGKNGFLIFRKDNPSGLPEYDDSFEIPILFE
ncbi:MAG: Gmad2 immunoglobulin-like domain-containing protein [Patescibacteria group bacterium]